MSTNTNILTNTLEDWLPYLVPIFIALGGFNWASIIPGNNNPILVAVTFGFLAKFLYGLQQTLSSNPKPTGTTLWEDVAASLAIGLGVVATGLSSDPNYLEAGTIAGFLVKALGYFSTGNLSEDLALAAGAILILIGAYTGNAELVSAGSLIALVGKTIPSLGAAAAITTPATSTPPATPAAGTP